MSSRLRGKDWTPSKQRLDDFTKATNALLEGARNEGRRLAYLDAIALIRADPDYSPALVAELQSRLVKVKS